MPRVKKLRPDASNDNLCNLLIFLPLVAGVFTVATHSFLVKAYKLQRAPWTTFDAEKLSWFDPKSPDPDQASTGRSSRDGADEEATPSKGTKTLIPISQSRFQLNETTARTLLAVSDFILLASGCALLIQSAVVLYRYLGWRWMSVVVAVVVLMVLIAFPVGLWTAMRLESAEHEIVSKIERHARMIFNSKLDDWSERLDPIENGVVVCVAVLFTLAMGVLGARLPRQTPNLAQIMTRGRDALELLNTCAVFLLVGVFHLWTQWNWPTTLLTTALDRGLVKSHSNARVFEYGALLTVTLAAVYFTAHWLIRHLARDFAKGQLLRRGQPACESAIREELAKGGFEHASFFDFSTLAKVMSPLFAAGPVAKIMSLITS